MDEFPETRARVSRGLSRTRSIRPKPRHLVSTTLEKKPPTRIANRAPSVERRWRAYVYGRLGAGERARGVPAPQRVAVERREATRRVVLARTPERRAQVAVDRRVQFRDGHERGLRAKRSRRDLESRFLGECSGKPKAGRAHVLASSKLVARASRATVEGHALKIQRDFPTY